MKIYLKYIAIVWAFSFLFGGILLVSQRDRTVKADSIGYRGVIYKNQPVFEIVCAPDLVCTIKSNGILIIDVYKGKKSATTYGENSPAVTGSNNHIVLGSNSALQQGGDNNHITINGIPQ